MYMCNNIMCNVIIYFNFLNEILDISRHTILIHIDATKSSHFFFTFFIILLKIMNKFDEAHAVIIIVVEMIINQQNENKQYNIHTYI